MTLFNRPVQRFWQCVQSPALSWRLSLMALVVLFLPSLPAGFMADDFLFSDIFNGYRTVPHPGALFGLYTFADGVAAHTQALKVSGQIPWWVSTDTRMMFWRPLSELSHWVDFQLWPHSALLMRLHSLAWCGLLMTLLSRWYRSLALDAAVRGLALLMFAVSGLHWLTVVWLAGRNQLMAACALVATLMLHDHWRRHQGGVRSMLLAWLACAAGLLCAEAGIGVLGYLMAYAVTLEPAQGWMRRIATVLPYLLVAIIWTVCSHAMGYGSFGLGGYIDPARETWRFLAEAGVRLPALALATSTGLSASLLPMRFGWSQAVYAVMATGILAWLIWLGARLSLWSSPALRCLSLGAGLALVPMCAAQPNDRLLINAELGLLPTIAALILRLASQTPVPAVPRVVTRCTFGVLVTLHLILLPAIELGSSTLLPPLNRHISRDLPLSLTDTPSGNGQHVLLLNPPDPLYACYYPSILQHYDAPRPSSLHALASGKHLLNIRRIDARTLELTDSLGFGDDVSRDFAHFPARPMDTWSAGVFDVEVHDVSAQAHPTRVWLRFQHALDDRTLRFMQWDGTRYVAWMPPAIGDTATLPPPSVIASIVKAIRG